MAHHGGMNHVHTIPIRPKKGDGVLRRVTVRTTGAIMEEKTGIVVEVFRKTFDVRWTGIQGYERFKMEDGMLAEGSGTFIWAIQCLEDPGNKARRTLG